MSEQIQKNIEFANQYVNGLSKYEKGLFRLIYIGGFIAGCAWKLNDMNDIVHYPISTIFKCSIGGIYYGIGASFVSYFVIPKEIGLLVPVLMLYSSYKHVSMII